MKRPPALPCIEQASERVSPDEGSNMDSNLVEELTSRLPISELVKIIKGALECGRRNMPFTESDLLQAMKKGPRAQGPKGPREEAEAQGT
ncbi:MAG: hypothetical protein ABI895_31545 [Deltaproteobacteria bacterium]